MTQLRRRVLFTSRTYLRDAAIENIDILRASIAHNSRAGISSSLMKVGNRFYQLLEGPPQELTSCLGRIAADRRHFDCEVLLDECDRCPRLAGCPMVFVQDPEAGGMTDPPRIAERLMHLPCEAQ